MKKALKVTGILAAVLVLVIFGGLFMLRSQSKQAMAPLSYETVDMGSVKDGTYEGQADAGLVKVRLNVKVQDHAISEIGILEHKCGLGKKAEAITQAMVSQNTFQVDAVSGATLSSEAIKSAVSKALKESSIQ
jgi:uncharacterized protein with FMN-binding domain